MLNDKLPDDFAIFFLTHGRAKSICTVDALFKHGFNGRYYIVIDDEDEDEPLYRARFGGKVIKFCKKDVDKWTDRGDNRPEDKRAILWARNACWDIAKGLGLRTFMMLEDDQPSMQIRLTDKDRSVLSGKEIKHFNKWVNIAINFLYESGAKVVSFAQGGDTIGGVDSRAASQLMKPKTMNSFICRTDSPIRFRGRFNEDCTDYVTGWSRGEMHWTIMAMQVQQKQTASVDGGMTEAYKQFGTYAKSMMSAMYAPSAVKIVWLNIEKSARIHHNVQWNKCVPKILKERYRK